MNASQGVAPAVLRGRINRERRQGHARCAALAPNLSELNEFGQAREPVDGMVPRDLADTADLTWANCSEFAVELQELGELA